MMYLNGSVSGALDPQPYALSSLVEPDDACLALDGHDGTRLVRGLVNGRLGQREHVI